MVIETAVILAAGEGKRLRPLTRNRPKPMLPAGNRPVLAHVLDALLDAGITDPHVVIGHRCDRIRDYFGHAYRDRPLTYHEQDSSWAPGTLSCRPRRQSTRTFSSSTGTT